MRNYFGGKPLWKRPLRSLAREDNITAEKSRMSEDGMDSSGLGWGQVAWYL
jgi:hypothetical protein